MLILVIFGNTTGVISKLLFIINFVLITRAMEFMGFIYYNGFIIGEFEKKNDLEIISIFIIINFYYMYMKFIIVILIKFIVLNFVMFRN